MGTDSTAWKAVAIPKPKIYMLAFDIVGDTPLITHAFPTKIQREILEKQMGAAARAKAPRDPWLETLLGLHWLDGEPSDLSKITPENIKDHRFGFPACGIKSAAIAGVRSIKVKGLTMASARQLFFVEADAPSESGGNVLVTSSKPPRVHEAAVRVQNSGMPRFRPVFDDWRIHVRCSFAEHQVSPEQILSLFVTAGHGVGLGDWRPARSGLFGRFHVEEAKGGEA